MLAYQTFTPHLKVLRAFGMYPLDLRTTSRLQFTFHQFYMRLCLFLPLIYAIQEIIYIYQVRNDVNKVIDCTFLFLTFTDKIYKQVVFWLKADKIEMILENLKGPLFNQEDDTSKKILSAMVTRAKITLYVFNSMAQSTCVLYILISLLIYLRGEEVDFAIWLPFNANEPANFYSTLFYVWIQATFLGHNNCTMDAFISFFYAQCTMQLRILRLDLESVVLRSKDKAAKESISFSKTIQQLFTVSLQHHHEIVRLAANVEDIFGDVLFYQFLNSGWILCIAVYRAVNMAPASVDFFSMISFLSCILLELFLYCYYGNELSSESEKLKDAAYAMDWLETPLEHRKILIMFMERVKKPITPLAGGIIPISASTFLSVLRSSYSFYAFLKTTPK